MSEYYCNINAIKTQLNLKEILILLIDRAVKKSVKIDMD